MPAHIAPGGFLKKPQKSKGNKKQLYPCLLRRKAHDSNTKYAYIQRRSRLVYILSGSYMLFTPPKNKK